LVFDDGSTFTVDGEYLLGREPEADERVHGGELRSIMIDDSSGTISRVHVEIRLDGWDVLISDTGSANGTFVMQPGQSSWLPLTPKEPLRLTPGTRVGLGQRSFVFESPSGSR
jgi:pSer/pThr/pTyr-binding forkhead associated (FHA) protein